MALQRSLSGAGPDTGLAPAGLPHLEVSREGRKLTLDEILTSRVEKQSNGCWLWVGYKKPVGRDPSGPFYGRYAQIYAHVFIYEAIVGPVPRGKELDHICRVTLCVNPAHLEPVRHRKNVLRGEGLTAQNAKKTCCPAGHAYTKRNTRVYIHPKTGQKGRFCRACERDRSSARRGGGSHS